MKLLTPFILILILSFLSCGLQQEEGFLPIQSSEEQTNLESPQNTFERVVNFDKFSLEFTTKNKTFAQKIQLIPMQSTNTGSIFFSLKNDTKNQRGWKISLNKGQGYDSQNINDEQLEILKYIFNKRIGQLVLKNDKISKIKLFQPEENNYCSFEVSQLKNQCWRIDVYPKKQKNVNYKYIAHLKMCATSPEGQKKFKKFTYLLNNKQLGKTSKE